MNNNRRQATWFSCGTDIRNAASLKEALEISNLNYEVVKEPVFLANGHIIPNQFCTKKSNSDEVFGIVGKEYTIVQNEEAFDFVDALIPEGMVFEKAGENKGSNWIIASLPEQYVLGDKMVPYVIFQNSHTGGTPVKASISPLRIACSNQFTIAWKEADAKVSIRHTSNVVNRLEAARDVLGMAASNMDALKKNAEKLAIAKVSESDVKKVIEEMFPMNEMTDTGRKIGMMNEERTRFMNAYNSEDLANFQGTKWGLLNAYSDFVTHASAKRKTENFDINRFYYVSLNTTVMQRFMDVLENV